MIVLFVLVVKRCPRISTRN